VVQSYRSGSKTVSLFRKRIIYVGLIFFSFTIHVAGKRKSAVELLQETKAFYVKSETVLDRKQELKNSGHLQVSQLSAPGAPPPRLLRKCSGNSSACPMQPTSPSQLPTPMTPPCCWASCHEQDRRKSDILQALRDARIIAEQPGIRSRHFMKFILFERSYNSKRIAFRLLRYFYVSF